MGGGYADCVLISDLRISQLQDVEPLNLAARRPKTRSRTRLDERAVTGDARKACYDFTAMKNTIPSITIGLDLVDKKHAFCVLNTEGEIIDERTIPNHRESLRRLSQKYPGARIAHEVGSHSPWISRFLTELGHEVIAANPRKLRAIYASDRKSDKNDARIIAHIARIHPKLLYPIQRSSEESQRDLLQVKLRDNLVRQRVDIIFSVGFTLKSLRAALPSPNSECFAKRCRTLLQGDHAALLESNHAPGTRHQHVPNKCEWKPDSLFHSVSASGTAAPHPAERMPSRPQRDPR